MSLYENVVRVLDDWRAPDDAQERLRGEFLRHLSSYPDGVWRSCVAGHITASTAVFDATGTQVLLTLHTKVKAWLQLGGHCEPGDETLAAAALREATEESGITGLRLRPEPVLISRLPAHCRSRASEHLDVQFVAVSPHPADRPPSPEADGGLRWFPVDALPGEADAAARRLVRAGHLALR